MADCDKAAVRGLADFIMDQLSGLEGVSCRPMMGGYVFYIEGRVFGGIYDAGQLMVKITPSSRLFMPDSRPEPPLPGAKEMLPCTILEDRERLQQMVAAMCGELPLPRAKRGRG